MSGRTAHFVNATSLIGQIANFLPLRGPLELDQSVPYFATIRSVHCRWAAMHEPLSMQSRALERRTVPDGIWVGYGYQHGVCTIAVTILGLIVRSWVLMRARLLVGWPAYPPACLPGQ